MTLPVFCLCAAFTAWLLRKDVIIRGRMSSALWVPLIWLLIYSSRPVSEWLGSGSASETDGTPIDVAIQLGLIAAAFFVLKRRRFPWTTLPSLNLAFFALFLYFAISIAWAPYPFIAFKRWFKELGHIFVVLIILTDVDPAAALKSVGARCAIILFPFSVVLAIFYPDSGLPYGDSAESMVTGVTGQKNSLGQICAVYGLILLWDIVDAYRARVPGQPWKFWSPALVVFAMGLWLLIASQSKTSLLGLLIGAATFFSTSSKVVRCAPSVFAKCIFVCLAIGLVLAAASTVVFAPLLEAVGRDATLTDRTMIWARVLEQNTDPLFGCGFYSFWLLKGPEVWETFFLRITTAHSGYLETYLDGGIIACALLGAFLVSTSWRLANLFSHTSTFSRVLFALMMMSLVMNFSETYLFRISLVWFCLVLATLASHPSFFPRRFHAGLAYPPRPHPSIAPPAAVGCMSDASAAAP